MQVVEFQRGEMLTLRDGRQQEIGVNAESLLPLALWRRARSPDHRRAQATAALQPSPAPKDRAEFQWRVTMPLLANHDCAGRGPRAALPLAGRWRMAAAVGLYVAVFCWRQRLHGARERVARRIPWALWPAPASLLAAVVVAFLGRPRAGVSPKQTAT